MIKAVLMESAKDIGQDIWTQGSGRVDVLKAATINSFISPSSLSLGIVDLSQTIVIYVDTLTVFNFSSNTSNYSFSYSGISSGD